MVKIRTNFYKLPINELKNRVKKLRDWWWDNPNDPRRAEVNMVLRLAYEVLQNREEIERGNKQLKTAVNIFWGDIPEKYEISDTTDVSDAISPELAKETGLKKIEDGWLFDLSQKDNTLGVPSSDKTLPNGLI